MTSLRQVLPVERDAPQGLPELGRDHRDIARSMQTIVRCDDPGAAAATRALLLEMIDAGVSHLVLAPVLAGRPVQWLADEIIEPVLAEARVR